MWLCTQLGFFSIVRKRSSIRSTGSAMDRKAPASRMKSSGLMDQQAHEDDAKSMEQIVKEEEDKAD